MTEKDYTYALSTGLSQLNGQGLLKPYVYQNLFGELVQQHLANIHGGHETTIKYGLAWVLIALSFEIEKPVQGCMQLSAKSWFSERRGPFFRREAVFYDEAGQTVFKGSTFSVLIDMEKRTTFRQRELPFALTEPIPEFTVEAGPIFKNSLTYDWLEEREVRHSHIDALGHMNNSRYGEFTYDTLTGEELEGLISLQRMDVYFVSELKSGEKVSLLKAYDGEKILVRGYNDEKKCIVFDYVMTFK
jgi:medium-chain acyl-[acyl-carrier-protein] hydrolase